MGGNWAEGGGEKLWGRVDELVTTDWRAMRRKEERKRGWGRERKIDRRRQGEREKKKEREKGGERKDEGKME